MMILGCLLQVLWEKKNIEKDFLIANLMVSVLHLIPYKAILTFFAK